MVAVHHTGFSYFRNFCEKFKFAPISSSISKFGEDRTIRGRVIAQFQFSKWQPSAIMDFHIISIFVKNSNMHLLLRHLAKFVEDRMIRG